MVPAHRSLYDAKHEAADWAQQQLEQVYLSLSGICINVLPVDVQLNSVPTKNNL